MTVHHILIPDTQIKPGVPTDHLRWAGLYIRDKYSHNNNVRLVHIGDHWDMNSLSQWDKGKKAMEGRRVKEDIKAGNDGFDILCEPWEVDNGLRTKASRWRPLSLDFFIGNHEDHITRAVENDAVLDGVLSLDDLNAKAHGFDVHPYLEPREYEGVVYAHYFYNPMTGRPYSGTNVELRLKTIGHSFTMGHQQGLLYGLQNTINGPRHGLVAGSFYLHDEDYKGPQGNRHWRGMVVCHQVEDGRYDPMFLSVEYLCQKYEGMPLKEFMGRYR